MKQVNNPSGGPWFRVPGWIGGRFREDRPATEAEAWVDLLGRWHQGEDVSLCELCRVYRWGKGRTIGLIAAVAAWAVEHGGAVPARHVADRQADPKRTAKRTGPAKEQPAVSADTGPESDRQADQDRTASCARNSSSSEKRSEGELEHVPPPPEPEQPKAAEPEPVAAPERAELKGWRAIAAEMKARAPASFPEPPKPPLAPPSIEDEDLGPSPVAGLDLSALMGAQATMHSRLLRALVTAGISGAEDLERMTYEDLKFMHGVGQAGAMAIQRALRERGADLALDKGRLMLLRELATAHPRPFPPEVTRADRLGLRAAKIRWRYLVNADDFQMNDYAKALEAGRRAA